MKRSLCASLIAVLLVAAVARGQVGAAPPSPDDVGKPCLVCRMPVPETGAVHLHRGRPVRLCKGMCIEKYEADPDTYFARIQAHGALFDEEATEAPSLASGWLIFGLYVLAGLIFGAACAYLAVARSRKPVGWFFAGLVANVPALIFLVTRPPLPATNPQGIPPGLRKVPVTHAPAICPKCGAESHPSATTCGSCNTPLDPSVESEVGRS